MKPRVITNPPANQYTGKNERIIEFNHITKNGQPIDGLIQFNEDAEGFLQVHIYRCSPGVRISSTSQKELK